MISQREPTLAADTIIVGKWHKHSYKVIRLLGEGVNGKVYLVASKNGRHALKIGSEPLDLQSEINVLKILAKSAEQPAFFQEADDFVCSGKTYSYYVMRYIKGERIADFVGKQGNAWLKVAGFHLLKQIHRLHRAGWVFGDLKPENVIVSDYGRVELVDYGGVTAFGNAVKQFTKVYDRAFWGAGMRTAEPAYDLFSFAVLMLRIAGKDKQVDKAQEMLPQNRSADMLLKLFEDCPPLAGIAPVLEKAVRGLYRSSGAALQEYARLLLQSEDGAFHRKRRQWKSAAALALALALFAAFFVSR